MRATAGSGSSNAAELTVSTYTVVASPLSESITATGSLLAGEGVTLQAEAAGRVTAIYFKEGAQVRKGDLLVKLNDLELRAMRDRASHRRELAAIRERRIQQLISKGVARQEEFDVASNERKVAMLALALLGAISLGGEQVGYASLVDLNTGRIVWFNQLNRMSGDLREPGPAVETVDALLKGFPGMQ